MTIESEKPVEQPEAQQTPEEQVKTLSDEELDIAGELIKQEKSRRIWEKIEADRKKAIARALY